MTNTAKALYEFFSSFGIPAFTEYDVPDEFPDENGVMQPVNPPYITYEVAEPDWPDEADIYARVWYRSTSYTEINAKVDEISAAIGGGVSIPTADGAVYLLKGAPFAQNMPMEGDDTLKVVYLNMTIIAPTT